MISECDVLIAGSGPAGSTAALVLAGAGRRVLMVDDVVDDEAGRVRKVGESLPGAGRPLLRDLGLLRIVEQGGHSPSYGNISVWGTEEPVVSDFIRDPNGLGWHLDRSRFDADLRSAAVAAGAEPERGRVTAIERDAGGWSVVVNGERIVTRWAVDATGRRAAVARMLGAVRTRDRHLVALHTWLTPGDGDRDRRTLVESVEEGWWYTAPLPDGTRVAALHLDPEDAAPVLRDSGEWETRIARTVHVRRILAGAAPLEPLRGAEACGARLDTFAGEGWLAVGDAALSFDPLSSQGILTALYTGMKAGHALDAALAGSGEAVKEYISRLESIREAYAAHHAGAYASEGRWPEHPFWRRRSTAVDP